MTVDFYTPMRFDKIDSSLMKEINENCDVDLEMCLECGKCSGGCSNAHIFDFTPRKIIQLIKLGMKKTLLDMDCLWTCASCQLCVDRCPSGINIPRIMDYLREQAYQQRIKPTREQVQLFHELMLDSIAARGRIAEAPLALKFNYRTGQYFKDADLGIKMFSKGKLIPLSPGVKNISQVRRLFGSRPFRKEE